MIIINNNSRVVVVDIILVVVVIFMLSRCVCKQLVPPVSIDRGFHRRFYAKYAILVNCFRAKIFIQC